MCELFWWSDGQEPDCCGVNERRGTMGAEFRVGEEGKERRTLKSRLQSQVLRSDFILSGEKR